jgi:hypothetical protein
VWPADDRFKHIFAKAEQYHVDALQLDIQRFDADYRDNTHGTLPYDGVKQSRGSLKMSICKRLIAAGGMALALSTLSAIVSTDALAQAPAVDPAAVQKFKLMTEFLDGLQQFSVNTQSIIEETRFSGHRVDFDLSAKVTVKRPNKLSAARSGQLLNEQLFYDGKTLSLYRPSDKTYAAATAPDTIEKMVDFARETVGILLPAADLVYRGAYRLMMQDVSLAAVIGQTVIGGVKCDHLLFSRPGVDFQIWIAEGKQPWPCKYVVTETDTPSKLSITTFLNGWNMNPAVQDSQFNFVPPKGVRAIPLPNEATGKPGR